MSVWIRLRQSNSGGNYNLGTIPRTVPCPMLNRTIMVQSPNMHVTDQLDIRVTRTRSDLGWNQAAFLDDCHVGNTLHSSVKCLDTKTNIWP